MQYKLYIPKDICSVHSAAYRIPKKLARFDTDENNQVFILKLIKLSHNLVITHPTQTLIWISLLISLPLSRVMMPLEPTPVEEESVVNMITCISSLTEPNSKRPRNTTFSSTSLAPGGELQIRLSTSYRHLPEASGPYGYCQLCYHMRQERVKGNSVLHCPDCNVNLCCNCYSPFHRNQNMPMRYPDRTSSSF